MAQRIAASRMGSLAERHAGVLQPWTSDLGRGRKATQGSPSEACEAPPLFRLPEGCKLAARACAIHALSLAPGRFAFGSRLGHNVCRYLTRHLC